MSNSVALAGMTVMLTLMNALPAAAWTLNSGNDQKSGRPYDIVQQWSKRQDAVFGLECQGGFDSGLLGIAIVDPQSTIEPSKTRVVEVRIGPQKPLKLSMTLERHPDYLNYTLTTKSKINAALFSKLVDKLLATPGDITVTFDPKTTFLFPDEQRTQVLARWIEACRQ